MCYVWCTVTSWVFFIPVVHSSKQFEAIQREAVTSSTVIGQCLEWKVAVISAAQHSLYSYCPRDYVFTQCSCLLFIIQPDENRHTMQPQLWPETSSTVSTDWRISASLILIYHHPISFTTYISTKNKRVHGGFIIMKLLHSGLIQFLMLHLFLQPVSYQDIRKLVVNVFCAI